MNSRDFCFWLQGYFEISGKSDMSSEQVDMVKRHLALVFKHEIDPSLGGNVIELQTIHDGKPPLFGGTDSDGNIMRC